MSGCDAAVAVGRHARTRRQLLQTIGAAGTLGLAGCSGGGNDATGGSTEGDANPVTVGVSIPTTGGALAEGEQLMAGYDLAVQHLADGAGLASDGTIQEGLGGGILGRDIETAVVDTESTAAGAEASATSLVEEAGADVLLGGGSSEEALAQAAVADVASTVYMAGFAPTPDITGVDCSPYVFSEMANTTLIGQALAPALRSEFGSENLFAQVYPNTDIGKQLFGDVQAAVERSADWRQIGAESARVGTTEFADPVTRVVELGPDVVVLNFTGLDGADALREARELIPEDIGIAVSVFNRPMARNAGDALAGIVGTVQWDGAIGTDVGDAFVDAWPEDEQPSGLAHLAYMQLFQYAAAAERAGSVDADAVVAELEGHQYDNGVGPSELRACDHQSMRPVPVVKGLPASAQSNGEYFRMVTVEDNVGYSCDEPPASACSL